MNIETQSVYDVMIVNMSGRLDSQSSGTASDKMVALIQEGQTKIVLNLEKLEFLSSAGLRVILQASKLLVPRRGVINICNAKGIVKEVLETSGFNSLINLFDDEKEAVAAMTSSH